MPSTAPMPTELSEKCQINLKRLDDLKKSGKCIPKSDVRAIVACLSQKKLIEQDDKQKDRSKAMRESWDEVKPIKCNV
jgi:hypothetical protein